MNIFGIGLPELILILVIALIILNPKDISKTARAFGQFLNRLYKSDIWRNISQASDTIRQLPTRLAREAQLEELKNVTHAINQARDELTHDLQSIDDASHASPPSQDAATSHDEEAPPDKPGQGKGDAAG
jgi:sec-independent protein translocase protein TatB